MDRGYRAGSLTRALPLDRNHRGTHPRGSFPSVTLPGSSTSLGCPGSLCKKTSVSPRDLEWIALGRKSQKEKGRRTV